MIRWYIQIPDLLHIKVFFGQARFYFLIAGGGKQSSTDCEPAYAEGGVSPCAHAVSSDGVGCGEGHAEHRRPGDGPLRCQHPAQPLPPARGPASHLQIRRHPRAGAHAQVSVWLKSVHIVFYFCNVTYFHARQNIRKQCVDLIGMWGLHPKMSLISQLARHHFILFYLEN